MSNEIISEIIYIDFPIGTKARLDRLIAQVNSSLGIKLKTRNDLIRLILLEGIADLEGECASLRGALILKYRKEKRH